MYQDYANIRDALNRTGVPMYLNICPTVKASHFPGLHPPCEGWDDVYTSLGFERAGLDVRALANSALVEFCNNANNWGVVMSLVDAQRDLALDSWSGPGSWIDADMLTVGCNDSPSPHSPCSDGTPLTVTEQYAQMTLWCIFTSNLMLGSDLRNISKTTLDIIGNPEALAVNRDPKGAHGRLVWDSGAAVPPPTARHAGAAAAEGGRVSLAAGRAGAGAGGGGEVTCTPGAFAAGGDVHQANMTIPQAVAWCNAHHDCGGFTARGVAPASCTDTTTVAKVYFKDATLTSNTDKTWTSWNLDKPRVQVFAKPMASGARAVAVLNRGSSAVDVTLDWKTIMVGASPVWGKAHVRDLWAHADRGSFAGSVAIKGLASHAASFLLVTEDKGAVEG